MHPPAGLLGSLGPGLQPPPAVPVIPEDGLLLIAAGHHM